MGTSFAPEMLCGEKEYLGTMPFRDQNRSSQPEETYQRRFSTKETEVRQQVRLRRMKALGQDAHITYHPFYSENERRCYE